MSQKDNHQVSKMIQLEFAATVEQVDKNIIDVKERLELEFSNYHEFALELVLREALMNAVKHGNQYDPMKMVFMNLSWDSKYFFIKVKDEGEGFTFEPETKTPPSAESGRGLPIIVYYADEMSYNKKGNEVNIKLQINKT